MRSRNLSSWESISGTIRLIWLSLLLRACLRFPSANANINVIRTLVSSGEIALEVPSVSSQCEDNGLQCLSPVFLFDISNLNFTLVSRDSSASCGIGQGDSLSCSEVQSYGWWHLQAC